MSSRPRYPSSPWRRRVRLHRWAAVEIALALAVLSVTAALVNRNTAPHSVRARPAAVSGVEAPSPIPVAGSPPALSRRPFLAHLPLPLTGDPRAGVHVTLRPAVVGRNRLVLVVLAGDGRARRVAHLSAWLSLPAQNIPELPIRLTAAPTGEWTDDTLPLPYAGDWILKVTVTGGGSASTVRVTVPLGT